MLPMPTVNVARLAYLSDLTTSYIEARYNQEAYALQQRSLASRRETLKLTNDIKAAGAASSLDVVQAEGLVNSTLAELPGYQTGFNQGGKPYRDAARTAGNHRYGGPAQRRVPAFAALQH